ncbi:MAG: hypothetical protein KatS3mg091_134 [Patescibacteria group bacterium]|nr:MAG: hypothetical protein KatS3mg091_134 [Patescibacteria group bacterium]
MNSFRNQVLNSITKFYSVLMIKSKTLLKKSPLLFLLIINSLLVLAIILGNLVAQEAGSEPRPAEKIKEVEIYRVGVSAKVKVKAKVEKDSSVLITALTSGIVKSVEVSEGDKVLKDKVLARLASNYWGANANYLQSKIAKTQLETTKTNYEAQKQVIEKNKELVKLGQDNRENKEKILKESIDRTKELISLNEDIIATLDNYLNNYQATNSAGINESLILSTKQLKSQYLSVNNQLKASLSDLEYSVENNTSDKIAQLNDEIVLRQLQQQEKTLELQLKLAELQYKLAKIQESLMYPSAIFEGVIEKVYIKPGQTVAAGSPLFLLNAYNNKETKVIAYVSESLASNLSIQDQARLYFSDNSYLDLSPYYISSTAVDGNLYTVYFKLPGQYLSKVSDKQQIEVELTVKFADSSSIVPVIPLEAVYLYNDRSYILVVGNDNRVKEVEVKLGRVIGGYVAVESGIDRSALVVLTRNAVAGDKVKFAD